MDTHIKAFARGTQNLNFIFVNCFYNYIVAFSLICRLNRKILYAKSKVDFVLAFWFTEYNAGSTDCKQCSIFNDTAFTVA